MKVLTRSKERFRFIPMIEAFNLFNHPDWQVTQTSFNGASPNAGGLGQAASEANYYVSRNLQFALKLTF